MIEDDSVCVVCSEGLHCPVGSTIEKLQAAESTSGSRTPFVKKGYHSNSATHGKTMQNASQQVISSIHQVKLKIPLSI